MSAPLRIAPFLLIATLAIAACGGSAGQGGSSASDPTAAAPTAAAPTVTADATDDTTATTDSGTTIGGTGDASAEGASNVVISGAVETSITSVGYCAPNNIEPADRDFGFDNLHDDFDYAADTMWMISIDIEDYAGAGAYAATNDSPGKASIGMSDGMGTRFEAGPDAGTLTVDAGDQSGSFDVTLTNEDTGGTVTVVGAFVCEA